MNVTVNLYSNKSGEIKGFLQKYYEKEINMDEDVGQWIYVYREALKAIDMISTVIDNSHKHQIGLFIQVDRGDIHTITNENCNDIIKALLYLYYKEAGTYIEE